AALLFLSSYRMGRSPSRLPPDEPLAETDAPEAPGRAARLRLPERELLVRYVAIGLLAGGLSGLLGIGGGVIMVPAFVALAGLEVKAAIATSLVCVGAFAVPGTITHVALDHVDWRVVAALVAGVIPGARVGAALTIRAADRRLRVTVASFLGLTAVVYAAGELLALQ
ncbi:MAG TPA: sulfite exporter TauE/SafE family protein, partial [Acidimicrobiales bacterium]|nr:sulfite exporter TauE/SafE family protein [Acidimicrobiales bacterium]